MNFSKKMLRIVSLVLMVLILIPAMPTFAATFTDVSSSHWANRFIEKMVNLKYINGYEDGTFKPKGTLTYLETIQLLSKLLDLTEVEKADMKLSYNKLVTELKIPIWAQDAVMKSLYKGVISETELKTASTKDLLRVGTNKRVGRLDISIFMAKAMGLEDEAISKPFVSLTYKDLLSIDTKYHKLIYVLVEAGVLDAKGTGDGYFEPTSPLLREQMAKMLATAYDFMQKNPPVATPVPVDATEIISGVLTKITTLGTNTFLTVKNRLNVEVAYLVDSKTTIKLDDKTTTISSLYEGQDIKVAITKGTNTALSVLATSVEEEITGVIKSITPTLNKLVIEYIKDKVTKNAELTVKIGADITLDGIDADLYDLTIGDEVVLVTENNIIIEIEAKAKTGEVEGIIVDLGSDFITIKNSKDVITEYELGEEVSIYRDGRRVSFVDLRLGDEAVIELEYGLVIDIDADMIEKELEGYITAINKIFNIGTEVTVRNRDTNKEETYLIARNALVKIDGKTSTAFYLDLGYFVEVVVGGNEIVEIYANSIAAESMVRGKITSISTRRNEVELDVLGSDIEDFVFGDEVTIKASSDLIITEGVYSDLVITDLDTGMTVIAIGVYDGYSFIAKKIIII